MDDVRIEDDEKEALAGLTSPQPRTQKIHSYSQQLRAQNRQHKHRKHSLDDIPKPIATVSSAASDPYYESSDDEFFPYSTTTANSADEDYVLQKLDQCFGLENGPDEVQLRQCQALPEFIGSGGGSGIFKVPIRSAVHPGRPPFLELRPHPLRETQVGKFLRNIACTATQLWAGQESGVRVWSLENAYDIRCGAGGKVRRGEEDAAPFHESGTMSPTMCLMVDCGNRLVWSGHKDGKIRAWKMEQKLEDNELVKQGISFQAHKGPVISIVMTSYGDLWSGSEGGVIKIWPWESIEKSLSLRPEEKHMAALLVERSSIDLRSQVTVNGTCSISSSDVKCLLSDNVRAKVWCAQPSSFSIWDARTKELLKVFNIDGQLENRVDMPSSQEQQQQQQPVEDEMKVKFVSTSKKEKSGGFLQRSRNAIMGAADAVRRVATRGTGAFNDETKKTEALLLAVDGMIWSGSTNGLLVQWDANGTRLQEFNHHPCAVQCFCSFGTRNYVGYVSGMIQVFDLEGNLLAGWIAHNSPVIKLAVGDGFVFSLATHGGIRGWNITSPGPLDNIIRSELAAKEGIYTRRESFRIMVGTWNVGQGRASHDSLMAWLGSVASDVGIIVIGLQEVDMGAGFLAMSAAKETVGLEGSSAGHWWLDNIGKALDEGKTFERMGSRQLAGLLISLWVRNNLRTHVGDIDAGAVACGFGRAIGNKGGVGLRIRVYDRIMCFVNCHLAAHLEAVNRRNADFDHIYRTMVFTRSSSIANTAAAGVAATSHALKSTNSANLTSEEPKPDLSEADMVVFTGDFNYRLFGISYDEARDFVSQRCFDWLREKDQLRAEMKAGKVFQGMREAIIKFPPTYKFERNQAGLGGYDSGEKKRIPAWCDRVIYRDTRSEQVSDCNLDCPVVSSIVMYEACMDVIESDHKPVRCKFHVQIAHADRSIRRQEFGNIIRSNEKLSLLLEELRYVPETSLSTNNIALRNQDTFILTISNKCNRERAVFQITCEGQSTVREDEEPADYNTRGAFGFPRWLEVTPAAGVIEPQQNVDICVHHEEFHTLEEYVDGIPQNWWCEDTRDKEVILVVNVQGSCSTETRNHQIRVRHCFSAKTVKIVTKSNSSKKGQGNRTEVKQFSSNSSDKADSHGSEKK